MHNGKRATSLTDLVALVVLSAETALVAVIAVGYAAYALIDRSFSGLGLSLAAVAAILAAALGVFTRGFAKHQRFALGGAMTWQLMQVSVGVWLLGTRPLLGVPLVITALIVAFAVLKRQSALGQAAPHDPSL